LDRFTKNEIVIENIRYVLIKERISIPFAGNKVVIHELLLSQTKRKA
jgi:hypothetical protein